MEYRLVWGYTIASTGFWGKLSHFLKLFEIIVYFDNYNF